MEVSRERSDGSDFAKFVVNDTGVGMSEDQIGKLFRPFIQIDTGTTKAYQGAGLGLALSSLFCEKMGGRIKASSVPGKGSTFTVHFPLDRDQSAD